MVGQPQYCDVKKAITEGIQSLKKGYRKVDNTSAAYFICLGKLVHSHTQSISQLLQS